jgi:hypothetical protein
LGRCEGAARHELGARIAELAEIDPQAELLSLVKRLIAASETEPTNTALARELRACLAVLPRGEELDPVQARQARVQARLAAMRAGVVDVTPLPRYLRSGGVTHKSAEHREAGADSRRSDG